MSAVGFTEVLKIHTTGSRNSTDAIVRKTPFGMFPRPRRRFGAEPVEEDPVEPVEEDPVEKDTVEADAMSFTPPSDAAR
jgi:hypothetical protein